MGPAMPGENTDQESIIADPVEQDAMMAERAAEKAGEEAKKEEYMVGPLLSEVEEELRDADAPQAPQEALLEDGSVDDISDEALLEDESEHEESDEESIEEEQDRDEAMLEVLDLTGEEEMKEETDEDRDSFVYHGEEASMLEEETDEDE